VGSPLGLSSSWLLRYPLAIILGLLLYFAPFLGAAWFISHKLQVSAYAKIKWQLEDRTEEQPVQTAYGLLPSDDLPYAWAGVRVRDNCRVSFGSQG
jgi:hypothetical protein